MSKIKETQGIKEGHYYSVKKVNSEWMDSIQKSFTKHPIQKCIEIDKYGRIKFEFLDDMCHWGIHELNEEEDPNEKIKREKYKEKGKELPEYTFKDFEKVDL